MRTAGAETSPKWERIFGSSLFWVTTRAVKCPYCMGHCEMNWEVAGLSKDEIAERSRLLSGDDWSSFPPAEQRAFAFARKLSESPAKDLRRRRRRAEGDFGQDRALIVMLNASRYHYMTRISNGFQLTLERENVFYDYYNVKGPSADKVPTASPANPAVELLSDEECWHKMPAAESGGGQPLPVWARAVAAQLPRTAAAMLQLDLPQPHEKPARSGPASQKCAGSSPTPTAAITSTEAGALADLERAGLDRAGQATLTGDPTRSQPEMDREPLEFARLLTVALRRPFPTRCSSWLRHTISGEKQVGVHGVARGLRQFPGSDRPGVESAAGIFRANSPAGNSFCRRRLPDRGALPLVRATLPWSRLIESARNGRRQWIPNGHGRRVR